MRALVIDDSAAVRALLRKMLAKLGVETAQASDGAAGLEAVDRDADYDFVLVDWNMPCMDGIEFVQAARRRPELDSLPIIMVTTENDLDKIRMALDAGADEFLMKPFTAEMIQEKLEILHIKGGV